MCQSLLMRLTREVSVTHLSAKLDLTCSEFAAQTDSKDIYLSRLLFRALKLAELNTKQKKNWCNMSRGKKVSPLSHISWSDFEPLFRKQKQAVWRTAQDNVRPWKHILLQYHFCWVLTVLPFESQLCSATNHRLSVYETNTYWPQMSVQYIDQTSYPQWCKHRQSDWRFE